MAIVLIFLLLNLYKYSPTNLRENSLIQFKKMNLWKRQKT